MLAVLLKALKTPPVMMMLMRDGYADRADNAKGLYSGSSALGGDAPARGPQYCQEQLDSLVVHTNDLQGSGQTNEQLEELEKEFLYGTIISVPEGQQPTEAAASKLGDKSLTQDEFSFVIDEQPSLHPELAPAGMQSLIGEHPAVAEESLAIAGSYGLVTESASAALMSGSSVNMPPPCLEGVEMVGSVTGTSMLEPLSLFPSNRTKREYASDPEELILQPNEEEFLFQPAEDVSVASPFTFCPTSGLMWHTSNVPGVGRPRGGGDSSVDGATTDDEEEGGSGSSHPHPDDSGVSDPGDHAEAAAAVLTCELPVSTDTPALPVINLAPQFDDNARVGTYELPDPSETDEVEADPSRSAHHAVVERPSARSPRVRAEGEATGCWSATRQLPHTATSRGGDPSCDDGQGMSVRTEVAQVEPFLTLHMRDVKRELTDFRQFTERTIADQAETNSHHEVALEKTGMHDMETQMSDVKDHLHTLVLHTLFKDRGSDETTSKGAAKGAAKGGASGPSRVPVFGGTRTPLSVGAGSSAHGYMVRDANHRRSVRGGSGRGGGRLTYTSARARYAINPGEHDGYCLSILTVVSVYANVIPVRTVLLSPPTLASWVLPRKSHDTYTAWDAFVALPLMQVTQDDESSSNATTRAVGSVIEALAQLIECEQLQMVEHHPPSMFANPISVGDGLSSYGVLRLDAHGTPSGSSEVGIGWW